jgi:hypothetical protein
MQSRAAIDTTSVIIVATSDNLRTIALFSSNEMEIISFFIIIQFVFEVALTTE